jgi:hypothetical protein
MPKPTNPKEPSSEPVTLELATQERMAAPAIINPEDPIGLFKLAIETKAGADTLERVMAVRRELRAEHAKQAYDTAMAQFQSECPPITKGRPVPTASGKIAYYYAPLENIISQVRPLMLRLGFSFSFDTNIESQPGWVIATCKVTHREGHSEVSTAKFPLGTKTAIMSETQVFAGALTFATRRVFCNAFGIVTEGEDRDGAGDKPKPKGPSALAADSEDAKPAAQELWTLLKDVRGPEKNWRQANAHLFELGILSDTEELPHVTAQRMREIIEEFKKHN